MPNAAYYRAQAELYRQVAQILSNPHDAEVANAAADRFLARAEQLEANERQGAAIGHSRERSGRLKNPGDGPPGSFLSKKKGAAVRNTRLPFNSTRRKGG